MAAKLGGGANGATPMWEHRSITGRLRHPCGGMCNMSDACWENKHSLPRWVLHTHQVQVRVCRVMYARLVAPQMQPAFRAVLHVAGASHGDDQDGAGGQAAQAECS